MAAHVAGIGQRAIAIATPIALAAYIFSPRSAEPMHAVTGADLLEREPLVAPSISLGQNAAMGALHNGHRFLTLNSDSKLHALGVELAISPEHLIVPEQCDARIKIPRSIEMHGEAHIAVEGAFEVFFNSPRVRSGEILLQMICASTDVDSQHDEKMLGIYTFAVSPEFFVRMFEARGNAELEQLFAEYSARGEARQFSSAESGFSRAFRVSPEGLVLKGIEHSSPPR